MVNLEPGEREASSISCDVATSGIRWASSRMRQASIAYYNTCDDRDLRGRRALLHASGRSSRRSSRVTCATSVSRRVIDVHALLRHCRRGGLGRSSGRGASTAIRARRPQTTHRHPRAGISPDGSRVAVVVITPDFAADDYVTTLRRRRGDGHRQLTHGRSGVTLAGRPAAPGRSHADRRKLAILRSSSCRWPAASRGRSR